MVDLLIGLLVFGIISGVIIAVLKFGMDLIPMIPAGIKQIVLYIAYAFIGIAVLVKYIAPLLKMLLSGSGF